EFTVKGPEASWIAQGIKPNFLESIKNLTWVNRHQTVGRTGIPESVNQCELRIFLAIPCCTAECLCHRLSAHRLLYQSDPRLQRAHFISWHFFHVDNSFIKNI